MDKPILYRKRLIPEECILLKDDIIIACDEDIIITKWNALKPKKDLHHGYSCYFLKEGYKVSKFYKANHTLLYWYCDIVDFSYTKSDNTMIVTDLLADVIIYPDGFVKVIDLEELVEALDQNKINQDDLKKSLLRMNNLLQIIYRGEFVELQRKIEDMET
ncbi:MAG TPA: DUF402 domain-containing protein [Lachnospiraceae bacterium]|nr:DUF402 domain-containing protein [Lachnospiraceae bacterium]